MSLHNLLHGRLLLPVITIICAVIFAFALVTRIMLEIAEHLVRVHSRYTYIEIAAKYIIISVYAGKLGKTTLRRIVVIPFEFYESAEITKKGRILVKSATEKIRDYTGNSDRLGYYFKDNELIFTEFFYNEKGFESLSELFMPQRFANNEEIIASFNAAKERFGNLPAPKPYVFEEMNHVKTRRIRELAKRIRKI